MATQNRATTTTVNPGSTLRTLKEANETIADPNQDIRGREVIAKDGEKIGSVDALLVDDQEAKIRFLRIESGGFLGIGGTKFLIPVEAITRVQPDRVLVNQSRDKISKAPAYDPDVVSNETNDYHGGLYNYYGYGPYWAAGYQYPLWW